MTIRELCDYFSITTPTYYNWKKEKPNLFKLISDFNKENENNLDDTEQEYIKLFRQLNEKEQQYYISEIKTRILKKEIEWNI